MKIRTKMAAFAVKSAAVAAMMAAVSCTKDKTDIPPPSGGNGKVTVKATLHGFDGAASSSPVTVRDLQACIFEDGKMTHIFDGLSVSGQQARLKSTESPSAALRNQDSCFRCQASSLRMM